MTKEIASEWCRYWAAYESNDVPAMQKSYDRISTMERVANHRKTTVKMLAQLLPINK